MRRKRRKKIVLKRFYEDNKKLQVVQYNNRGLQNVFQFKTKEEMRDFIIKHIKLT